MPSRRQVLLSGTAAWVAAAVHHADAQTPSEQLNRLFDSFMAANLAASPEETTGLGLDNGARAWEKHALDNRSAEYRVETKRRLGDQLRQIRAFDRAGLQGMDRISYDVVAFALQASEAANGRYAFGSVGAGVPYVISQLTGAYVSIPEFLDGQHQIVTAADATAYLARLAAFAKALDQEVGAVRHDVESGCVPPDFVLASALQQMTQLRSVAPHESGLVSSLVRRTSEKQLSGDYGETATQIVAEQVYPALDRQVALLKELQRHATHDAGVWKFPEGDHYYVDSIIRYTSSPLTPAEIHRMGLEATAECSAHIDRIMKEQGMTRGSVGERIHALFADPRFRYPNTDAGKAKLLSDLNAKVRTIRARLPRYFGVVPKADVVAKRVPQYMESARISGYYQSPSLDGKRPGVFYINLRDTAETPTWKLTTHTYHESIPGHHVKLSLYQETNLPLIRKIDFYGAYLEGWSLYAEQLADEMGMYDDDPFGRIGYLHSVLRASVAMVVDSGLHAKRWPRSQAIEYFTTQLGDPISSATTEIDRYCVWPGQVCSYLLDKLTIVRLREKAKTALGARFDIRSFHDAILLCGAAPHSVLERVVDQYISSSVTSPS
jgi:uncharacterized protein (DUF885 family)